MPVPYRTKFVDTHDFDFFNREEADVFIDTVGIEKRYVATDDICASDLCLAAAENLIAKLGWNKEEIDILSFASVTGDYRTPPTSCILQERLGLSDRLFYTGYSYGMLWLCIFDHSRREYAIVR